MAEARIRINTGEGYDVAVGRGLLERCGPLLARVIAPCRIAVITDAAVRKLYLDPVRKSLEGAGFRVSVFSFPAGESSKNMATLVEILEFLAEEVFTRSDCLAALGGGVAGDLAGFAAGCYLRGLPYIQLPTTLLAAVDSAVGGKTAVNLSAGKNLAGLFLQPQAVFCDPVCFDTLPPGGLAGGLAEAIKTGVLSGETLFSLFEGERIEEKIPEIVARCVTYKGGIVESDAFEKGPRRLLNLGHTVGHAIEKCSGYRISHGHAVAAGLAVISRASVHLGCGQPRCAARIERVLKKAALPVTTSFSAGELAEAARGDKKRSGDQITLVLPKEIGDCLLWEIPVKELRGIIAAGLEVNRSWS